MFAGGVFQAGNLVQVTVVELLMNFIPGLLNLGEINNPAKNRVKWALQVNFDVERVPVQACARMGLTQIG